MTAVLELSLPDPASCQREIVSRQMHSWALGQPVTDERDTYEPFAYEPFAAGRGDLSATDRVSSLSDPGGRGTPAARRRP